ncbi:MULTISPECIES: hypothetical protein [Pectinatus]|uniref:hypothetical protein n=1 Tax=Pectinatus TaxID=864 RepID=UPI0018C7B8AE|nr:MULTISPECIES: hypothetical protein [Pectinatus]
MLEMRKAIIALNKDKVLEICKERNLPITSDEKELWRVIHKTRLFFTKCVSRKQKGESRKWLVNNGYIK